MQHDAMVTTLRSLKLFGMAQAVTELAFELGDEIPVDEFRIFNGCLDDAIAHFLRGSRAAV